MRINVSSGRLDHTYLPSDSGNYWENYLSCDWGRGVVTVDSQQHGDTSHTFYCHYGHEAQYPMPCNIDGEALVEWLTSGEVQAVLDRVLSGYSSQTNWQGNELAEFSDDAAEARRQFEEMWDAATGYRGGLTLPDGSGWWEAREWLYNARHDLGVTAESTDAELEAIANQLDAEALGEDVRLDGTQNYLSELRDELRDA